jgi:D-tyrosyl-tRNA(Tyr) deacylase
MRHSPDYVDAAHLAQIIPFRNDFSCRSNRMRAVVQRVSQAQVVVEGDVVGRIGRGLVVLLGVAQGDTADDVSTMADKLVGLRVFDDADGKMNLALADVGGAMLVVSQFTLLGDCRKGRRPSYVEAAPPELAEALYELVVAAVRKRGIEVATGRFRTHMDVTLTNDGPVTLLVDTRRAF